MHVAMNPFPPPNQATILNTTQYTHTHTHTNTHTHTHTHTFNLEALHYYNAVVMIDLGLCDFASTQAP